MYFVLSSSVYRFLLPYIYPNAGQKSTIFAGLILKNKENDKT
jgi:hypothetical protein